MRNLKRLLPPVASQAALAALVWMLGYAGTAAAQSPCDPSIPRNESQSSGYQQRDDRCEGKYKREVSSFGVQLVSLTGTAMSSDLCAPGQAVHFVWPASAGAVRLQVESLKPNLEYRLNTTRPARSSSYAWPPQPRCNNDVQLRSTDLAIVARTESSIGSKPIDVLVPVTLAAKPDAAVGPPYRAVLVPGRRIQEVYVSLWQVADAATRTEIVRDRPLKMRPYPSGVQIPVELPASEVKKPGLYRLMISVEFESGQVEAIERYFIGG